MRLVLRFDEMVLLRDATPDDVDRTYEWQLEPATRRFARSPEVPERAAHAAWFAAKLDDPDAVFKIVLADGEPCGVVRLDRRDGGGVEISIHVSQAFHRRGIARAALALIREAHPDVDIHAYVMSAHSASRQLFAAAGYVRVGGDWYVSRARSI